VRIGINLLYLIPGEIGGTATYARGLLEGIARLERGHEYIVFTNRESQTWQIPEGPFRRVVCPVDATNRPARYAFEQVRLPWMLWTSKIDVVHSLGYVAPLFPGRPSVVTIPDLNYRNYKLFGMPLMQRLALRMFVQGAAIRATHILTISEFSRAQLCEHVGVPPAKVSVTYLAADGEWSNAGRRRERTAGASQYAVAVGNAGPHKNLRRLVCAYERAREMGLRYRLVLAGHPPPWASAQLPEGVEFTGYLSKGRLVEVVSGASVMIFPSLHEGFGLPVLEAMAAGVPVICSDRTSLPEVAGDAALFFNPESTEDIAERLCEVAFDRSLQEKMRAAGYENGKRFSWDRTAEQTVDVYERVALKR
jgi:glycosyltransferase involved in cell wall biosynthesis